MKKNFFQIFFNKVVVMTISSILLIVLVSISKIPLDKSTYSNNKLSNLITTAIQSFLNAILTLGTAILLLAFLLIAIEVYIRLKHDKLSNLVKSVLQTFKIRRFVKQDEIYTDSSFTASNRRIKVNPTLEKFNRNTRYCIVDIRINEVTVLFKSPDKQQPQKILKNMEQQLIEEITYLNPDYYFSGLDRSKNYLYIKGNKR